MPLKGALKCFFLRVQTCVLVDVNHPLPWVFTRWLRADSLPVSRALGRTSRFCNTLLQDLAPLHVKTTRSTNLLSVCRRKLKLSTYLQTVIYNHISFLNARSQLVWILLALDSIQARSQVFFFFFFIGSCDGKRRRTKWDPEGQVSRGDSFGCLRLKCKASLQLGGGGGGIWLGMRWRVPPRAIRGHAAPEHF